MKSEMKKHCFPESEFYEEISYFKVVFRNNMSIDYTFSEQVIGHESDTQSDTESDTQSVNNSTTEEVLDYCKKSRSAKEIREHLEISSKRYVAYKIIKPLINAGLLEYTNKTNINARNQRYITKIK